MKKWIVLVSLLTVFNLFAANSEPPLRFLFLVDTSLSMSRVKKVTPKIVGNLIASGFQRWIQRGERFEIWTFNEQVLTNQFATRIWTEEDALGLSVEATRFLSKQRFSKTTRMDKVLEEVKTATATTPKVTILILTDGDGRFAGTPFDRSINAIFSEFSKKLRREKKPFVVVLQGENGVLTGWRVHTGGGEITFPDMPDPLRDAPTVLTERFVTNIVVPPKTSSVVSPPNTPTELENSKPAAEELLKASAPVVPPPPAVVAEAAAPEKKSIITEVPPEKKQEIASTVSMTEAVSNSAAPTVAQRTSPPIESPPKEPRLEIVRPKQPFAAPAPPASAEPNSSRTLPIGFLALAGAGVGLALICAVAYLVLSRSKKTPPPSLISRSLDGDEK